MKYEHGPREVQKIKHPSPADFSPDQVAAVKAVMDWWAGLDQTFSLAGFAGTGKTTLTAYIIKVLEGRGVDVVVGTPTGKAAQRLREKGSKAETIHRLAYRLVGQDEEGNPEFEYEGLDRATSLLVIDEASMVDRRIYDDLVGGGYRILFVGDHGQLPPVGEDPGIMRQPDFALEVVHRQDDDGLLGFAHELRMGEHLPCARGAAEVLRIPPGQESDEVISALLVADTVICWRNKTRHWLNHLLMHELADIRPDLAYEPGVLRTEALESIRERKSEVPVVCLKNDYRRQVFNGQVFRMRVLEVSADRVVAGLVEDGEDHREVELDPRGFGLEKRGYQPAKGTLLFDFGGCLTVHKSQGSEWPWVTVYDDTYRDMDDRPRWAYTAATRAERRLTWLHR